MPREIVSPKLDIPHESITKLNITNTELPPKLFRESSAASTLVLR